MTREFNSLKLDEWGYQIARVSISFAPFHRKSSRLENLRGHKCSFKQYVLEINDNCSVTSNGGHNGYGGKTPPISSEP